MIFAYAVCCFFLSLASRYFLYMIDASTFAGLEQFGSFKIEITDKRILKQKNNHYVQEPLGKRSLVANIDEYANGH